jgi:hypothetical protein
LPCYLVTVAGGGERYELPPPLDEPSDYACWNLLSSESSYSLTFYSEEEFLGQYHCRDFVSFVLLLERWLGSTATAFAF